MARKHTYLKWKTTKCKNKIIDISENFKNVNHGEQAELLAKITDQIEQFIWQEITTLQQMAPFIF